MQPRGVLLKKQPSNKGWCGPACLYMAYSYLNPNFKTTITKIANAVRATDGVYDYKMGMHALKRGYYVRKIGYNSSIHPRECFECNSKEEMLDYLKKYFMIEKKKEIKINQENLKVLINGEIKFLENGGVLEVRVPRYEDLEEIVKRDNIPILRVDRKILYGKEIGETSHFVVVNNINKMKL